MRSRFVVRVLPVAALLVIGGLAPSASVQAAPPKGWSLPPQARAIGDDVYEISSEDVGNGRTKFCWAIIDRGHGHEAKGAAGGSKGGGGGSAYTYLASGLKWKGQSGESYVVDPTVGHKDATLDTAAIRASVAGAIHDWNDAADGTVDGSSSVNILGGENLSGSVDRAKLGAATNNVNEVCFANINESGVIAVTYVWGYYSGPTFAREIFEWDQIYDDDGDWTWSGSGAAGCMDFRNIAEHEVGHAFGMGHAGSAYPHETMAPTAGFGETEKRDLNTGDIAGINNLY